MENYLYIGKQMTSEYSTMYKSIKMLTSVSWYWSCLKTNESFDIEKSIYGTSVLSEILGLIKAEIFMREWMYIYYIKSVSEVKAVTYKGYNSTFGSQ